MSDPSRRRRRVVVLSPQDRERVARGDEPRDLMPTAAGADALTPIGSESLPERGLSDSDVAWGDRGASGEHANDARLLGDVPPHWQ